MVLLEALYILFCTLSYALWLNLFPGILIFVNFYKWCFHILFIFLLKKILTLDWCWAERELILDTDCCPGTSPISFSYNLQSWGISAWTESVCFLLTPLALSHLCLLPGPGLSRQDCTACGSVMGHFGHYSGFQGICSVFPFGVGTNMEAA